MNVNRLSAAAFALAISAGLAACAGRPPQPSAPVPDLPPPPVAPTPPAADADAVPRIEPRSRKGNPPFYNVLGKRYYVLSSSVGYRERGVASWYGPGFHKFRTANGEFYDMYGMTAAHRTLPLPAYVRVTNLQNGRSAVVRVNDRGPFVGNRIIDLSYTAAAKLGMLRNGTAMVDIRAVEPSTSSSAVTAGTDSAPPPADTGAAGAASVSAPLYVQAGAFSDPQNAERMVEKLRGGSYGKIAVRDDQIAGRRMYRVRIGPVRDVAEFDRVVAALEKAGIADAHLALD
jgi:rare lipoprotein A